MDQAGFGTEATVGLSYNVLKGNLVSPKLRALPSGALPQTLNLADFLLCRYGLSII